MSNEIRAGGVDSSLPDDAEHQRRLIPMKVGNATVFIQHTGVGNHFWKRIWVVVFTQSRRIQSRCFEKAVDVIGECGRICRTDPCEPGAAIHSVNRQCR